eukprot:gene9908-7775_t
MGRCWPALAVRSLAPAVALAWTQGALALALALSKSDQVRPTTSDQVPSWVSGGHICGHIQALKNTTLEIVIPTNTSQLGALALVRMRQFTETSALRTASVTSVPSGRGLYPEDAWAGMMTRSPGPSKEVEAEKQARLAAERRVQELEAQLKQADAGVQLSSQRIAAAEVSVQTSNDDLDMLEKRTSAAEVSVQNSSGDLDMLEKRTAAAEVSVQTSSGDLDMLEKVLNMNETMKQQIMMSTAKATAAKDLSAARYQELVEVQRNLRSEEKMVKKVKDDVDRARTVALKAQEDLEEAKRNNAELQRQMSAEGGKAFRAEQGASELQQDLSRAQELLSNEEARLQKLLAENKDAAAAFSLRNKLTEAKRVHEVMTDQVNNESARAEAASSEMAKVQAAGQSIERLKEQAERERKLRQEAEQIFRNAAAELQAERRKAEEIKGGSNSSSGLIEQEQREQDQHLMKVRELETKLSSALKQLENQSQTYAEADTRAGGSNSTVEALEQAQATILVLQQQMAGEADRVNQARERAAATQRELAEASRRLQEEEKKLEQRELAEASWRFQEGEKKLHLASAEATRAIASARAAEAALEGPDATNEEFMSQLQQEVARGDNAERQVVELKASLAKAKAQMRDQTSSFENITVDARRLASAQEELANALAMNEILKKQVLAEGSRATRSAKELANVKSRVKAVENTLESMKSETAGMKGTVLSLRTEILKVFQLGDVDKLVREVNNELQQSKKIEVEEGENARRMRQNLDVARSRVNMLEMELSGEKKRQTPQ